MAEIITSRKKPEPRSTRGKLNRARQYKVTEGQPKDISVTLMDMDSAIMYYFENVIKPTVFENGEQIKVPTMYASPERWHSINKTGFMRDSKRQVILPVIAFRRTGMEKDDTIAVDKIDPLDPKLFYTFERKFTDNNRYDNFAVQQGIIPQKEYYNVAVPDYMVLNYDFIIFTHYIEQMNKLVERINWSAGSYWGEPGKMRFKTNIESYTDSTELADRDRVVKTEFSVSLKGYLIPDAFNELQGPHTMQKYLTPKRLIIGAETDLSVASIVSTPDDGTNVTLTTQRQGSTSSTLTNKHTINQGDGISITNTGIAFDGANELVQNISLDSSFSPTFAGITTTGNITSQGDIIALGNVIAKNYIVSSSVTFQTQSFSSGSTIFGDTLSDTHQFTGSVAVTGSATLNGSSLATTTTITSMDTYLRKSFVKKASSITANSTASFTAVTASAPSGLTSTSEDDFIFFVNGQYMEHDALQIQQTGATFLLKVDTDSIGYFLESDDEIVAQGKFNA